jgi:transcriptional regulator of acetoin/glycerol metabolism
MIERGVVMSTDGVLHLEDMFPHHFPHHLAEHTESPPHEPSAFVDGFPLPYSEAKQIFEKAYLKKLLAITRGNIAEASRISGQYRANLYRMLQKYNMTIDFFKH